MVPVLQTNALGGPAGACPYCDEHAVFAFNWACARTGKDPRLSALRSHLKREERLKFGRLYRCPDCDQAWYLDASAAMATRVPRAREALLRDWSSEPLPLTAPFAAALGAIGSVAGDRYGDRRVTDRIPCSIQFSDGAIEDPCLVLVTDFPPILETLTRVRLFRHVAQVRETEFALPLTVRSATRSAEERNMGFAPTAVEDPSGRMFLLNWSADVFDYDGVRGKDIQLSDRPWPVNPRPPVVSEPRDRITYVFVDRGTYAAALSADC